MVVVLRRVLFDHLKDGDHRAHQQLNHKNSDQKVIEHLIHIRLLHAALVHVQHHLGIYASVYGAAEHPCRIFQCSSIEKELLDAQFETLLIHKQVPVK